MTHATRQSVAYQIYTETFDATVTQPQRKPREEKAPAKLKSVPKRGAPRKHQKNDFKSNPLQALTPYLVILAVVAAILVACNMQMTQLISEVSQLQSQRDDLMAENVSLSTRITSGQDLGVIEQQAIEMGMVKVDSAQIEYVEMTKGDVVTVKQEHETAKGVMDSIAKSFSAILEYIR